MNFPKITSADIEDSIAQEYYFTGQDVTGDPDLLVLTVCILKIKNGFLVTGESACVSPENFNAELGRKLARENAVDKLWGFLGFSLKDKLFG